MIRYWFTLALLAFASAAPAPDRAFTRTEDVIYGRAFGNVPTDPEAKRKFAEGISPIYHVKRGVPPVFIIHGDADKLVPIQQAQVFLEKVKAAGGVGKLDTRVGALHGWADWEADVALFAGWFDQHLKLETKP